MPAFFFFFFSSLPFSLSLSLSFSVTLSPWFNSSKSLPAPSTSLRSSFLSLRPPQRGKYMYASGKLCYLVAIQNAIPRSSLPPLIRDFVLRARRLASYRHLFLIQTYFCRPLILPTSSRSPARLRRESKTARAVLIAAAAAVDAVVLPRAQDTLGSLRRGYSTAYLGIHTKKLCV